MGSESIKPPAYYYPRSPLRPILKRQASYPNSSAPIQTGYPENITNQPLEPTQNAIPQVYTSQTQVEEYRPENSSPTHKYHSHHHHNNSIHVHHHPPPQLPIPSDRATQTNPSVFFRADDSLQISNAAFTKTMRVTPSFLRDSSCSFDDDDFSSTNPPPATLAQKSTPSTTVQQYPSTGANKNH
ncbi:unnamed protein product [Rotaria socialis]|uniref:Uncharacterized protein n=1 Tax=Rotaria socialis TaxID=392032 RepID=A0A818S3Y1_9BILA|nr:unnamed protein product [Rotaria socialis]